MHCIICKASDLKQIRIKKIDRTGFKCGACSFVFLWPQLSDREIESIYEESYYRSWGISAGAEIEETVRLKKGTSNGCLKRVMLYKRDGKLLDIGSAFGYLLEEATDCGFDAYGVELSPFSSAIAKGRFGPKVFEGKLEDARFPDGNFDVITMLDLIEHIPQPLEFMKEVRRVTKPGGIIAITTPDTSSLSYKILGTWGWFHWKLEHLGYFNMKSIRELANRTGFRMIEKRRAYKAMSFQYLFDQFTAFPHPIFSPLMRIIGKVFPGSIRHRVFYVSGGEMLVILKAE